MSIIFGFTIVSYCPILLFFSLYTRERSAARGSALALALGKETQMKQTEHVRRRSRQMAREWRTP